MGCCVFQVYSLSSIIEIRPKPIEDYSHNPVVYQFRQHNLITHAIKCLSYVTDNTKNVPFVSQPS